MEPLESWIVEHWRSDIFRDRNEHIKRTASRSISASGEVAMMVGLIERMMPDAILEIGTFFAGTSVFLAEAMVKNGKGRFVTIDPFGGERVPALIAKWPDPLQAITEFHPQMSMEYFAGLQASTARDKPNFGLIFVDGNHRFEYAMFDICAAATLLAPGGVIVADNFEQTGPRLAAQQFLRMNPAWKVFDAGKIKPASEISPDPGWGVLIAPDQLQVGSLGYQLETRVPAGTTFKGVALNVVGGSEKVSLTVAFTHDSRPFDFHITGVGDKAVTRTAAVDVRSNQGRTEVRWDAVAGFPEDAGKEMNAQVRLELSVADPDQFLLLDGNTPLETLTTSA